MNDEKAVKLALAGLSERAKPVYASVFNSFLSLSSLEEATVTHIREWVAERESRVSRRTLKQQLYMLSRLFKVAGREDLSEEARALAKEIRVPPPLPKVNEDLLRTYEEIDDILSRAKPLQRAAIMMLAETGMRVGELVSLEWGDIDLTNKRARVRGKGGKDRYVYFTERTAQLLRELPKESERVFPITDRTVQRWVRELLGTHPHAVRHAFAVWFLSKGGNPRVLQRILGHSSLRTTEVYLDLAQSLVEREYRKVVT